MKQLSVALIIMLFGCLTMASDKEDKPDGEELFDILFKNSNLKLSQEPQCNITSITRKNKSITLGEHLATIFSVSYETKSKTHIQSSCTRSMHETRRNKIIPVWDCNIDVLEQGQAGEFISSSTISFSIGLDKSGILPGSIRCL